MQTTEPQGAPGAQAWDGLWCPKPEPRPAPVDRMMAISERFAAYPVLDSRSPDEIIGYDEFGVPHYRHRFVGIDRSRQQRVRTSAVS